MTVNNCIMAVYNCSMTVNYRSILTLEIIGFFTEVIYHGKLLRYFYNIGPGVNVAKLFFLGHILSRESIHNTLFSLQGKNVPNKIIDHYRVESLARDKHTSLLGSFVSCKGNKKPIPILIPL